MTRGCPMLLLAAVPRVCLVIGVHTRVHTHTPLSHTHMLIPSLSFSHLPSKGAASAEEEVVSDKTGHLRLLLFPTNILLK